MVVLGGKQGGANDSALIGDRNIGVASLDEYIHLIIPGERTIIAVRIRYGCVSTCPQITQNCLTVIRNLMHSGAYGTIDCDIGSA